MPGSIACVRDKIFRAIFHGKCIEPELVRYFKSNPGAMVREPDSTLDAPTFVFRPKGDVPALIRFIIGDCLQNLRSSLDYLVWELVLANNNDPGKYNMFPICDTPAAFKKERDKRDRLLGVHPDAITLIEALQPYHLGKDREKSILWVLNELTNFNKHRRVLLTALRAARSNIDVVNIDGELWGSGSIPTFDGDAKIGPPSSPAEMQMNTQLLACVTFDEGSAKGMEITLCLDEWLKYVLNSVVPNFEQFFA
jgi:hypothetical protein